MKFLIAKHSPRILLQQFERPTSSPESQIEIPGLSIKDQEDLKKEFPGMQIQIITWSKQPHQINVNLGETKKFYFSQTLWNGSEIIENIRRDFQSVPKPSYRPTPNSALSSESTERRTEQTRELQRAYDIPQSFMNWVESLSVGLAGSLSIYMKPWYLMISPSKMPAWASRVDILDLLSISSNGDGTFSTNKKNPKDNTIDLRVITTQQLEKEKTDLYGEQAAASIRYLNSLANGPDVFLNDEATYESIARWWASNKVTPDLVESFKKNVAIPLYASQWWNIDTPNSQ